VKNLEQQRRRRQ
jgi:hypothetical protein